MQIAILLDVAAVCANVSMGFSEVCYPVIKVVAVSNAGCVALKNKGELQCLQVLGAGVHGRVTWAEALQSRPASFQIMGIISFCLQFLLVLCWHCKDRKHLSQVTFCYKTLLGY